MKKADGLYESFQIMITLTFMIRFTPRGGIQANPSSPEDSAEAQQDRPNILWISPENITPMMGCYGDAYASTPLRTWLGFS